MNEKIILITNIAPHYRETLWAKLIESFNIEFYYGQGKSGVKEMDLVHDTKNYEGKFHFIKNYWLQSRLVWQSGILLKIIFAECTHIILLGEMTVISNWIIAIISKLKEIKLVFWGHGLYGNEKYLKLFFRKIFFKLADKHLVYERHAKKLLISQGFCSEDIFVVFNSLNYNKHKILREKYASLEKKDVLHFFANPELPALIFIGRLQKTKKIELLLIALDQLNQSKVSYNLLIIGDGPERQYLEQISQERIKNRFLHFYGASYSDEETGMYLSVSDLCVSPGNVGLTAIHSLSFGTPVCTHSNNVNQMPEAGSIIPSYNGCCFKENSADDLAIQIKKWFSSEVPRYLIKCRCFEIVDKYYNPEYQAGVIKMLINNHSPNL